MSQHRIEYQNLFDLVKADRNAKRHADKDIRASINRFGYTEPIMIDERTEKLVAGHGRLEALIALNQDGSDPPVGIGEHDGLWMVPVIRGWASKDDAEAEAYLLASNQLTISGGWDNQQLLESLDAVDSAVGLVGTGFTEDDLAELRRLLAKRDKKQLTDQDDAPAKPRKAKTKLGDVWVLGDHRITCGDCRDASSLRAVLGGVAVDMVFTDPPYGVSYVGKTEDKLTIENDTATGIELADLLMDAFVNAKAHCRPGANWYVCGPAGPNSQVFGSVLGRLGLWRQTLIWVKDRFVMGRSDFHYKHEVMWAGGVVTEEEPPDEGYEDLRYGWVPGGPHRRPPDRRNDTVWEIPRPSASRLHPTMKPVELITRAIECSSAPGELVLDPFLGSGSTLIAAHDADRYFAGIELDPFYVDVICRRFEEHTGITPVLEGKGSVSFLEDS